MPEAYIVEAVRSPVGKKRGGLSKVHSADLGAHAIKGLVERSGIDPGVVDDVVFGCVDSVASQAGDIARTCWLAAGYPEHVPGVTIDRQCGSSQQAVHFAAQGVMSGTQDVVVAGGVQNMSTIPIGASMIVGKELGIPDPFSGSVGWTERYGDKPVNQFYGAEMIAKQWDLSREELEQAQQVTQWQRKVPLRGICNLELPPEGASDSNFSLQRDLPAQSIHKLAGNTMGISLLDAALRQRYLAFVARVVESIRPWRVIYPHHQESIDSLGRALAALSAAGS